MAGCICLLIINSALIYYFNLQRLFFGRQFGRQWGKETLKSEQIYYKKMLLNSVGFMRYHVITAITLVKERLDRRKSSDSCTKEVK